MTCVVVRRYYRKVTLEQAVKDQIVGNSALSLTSALYGGEVNITPRLFTLSRDTQYPFYKTLGGLQGWSGRVRVDILVLGQGFLRVSWFYAF
jgi:hypothetical protein